MIRVATPPAVALVLIRVLVIVPTAPVEPVMPVTVGVVAVILSVATQPTIQSPTCGGSARLPVAPLKLIVVVEALVGLPVLPIHQVRLLIATAHLGPSPLTPPSCLLRRGRWPRAEGRLVGAGAVLNSALVRAIRLLDVLPPAVTALVVLSRPRHQRLPVSPVTEMVTPSLETAAVLAAVRRIQIARVWPTPMLPRATPEPAVVGELNVPTPEGAVVSE